MRIAGRIARLVALLCLGGFGDHAGRADTCALAFEAAIGGGGDWGPVVIACDDRITTGEAGDRDRVRRLWALYYLGRGPEVLRLAPPLYGARDGADARYLSGRLLAQRGDGVDGRHQLWEALARYAVAGNRGGVSRASCDLARAANDDDRFDAALTLAQLCARTANPRRPHLAQLALADAYDLAGLQDAAIQALFDAEDSAATSPAALAWAYWKHGVILLDRRTVADTAVALAHLDEARVSLAAAAPDATLEVAIALNRAVALAMLDRDREATAALATAVQLAPDVSERAMYGHVLGVLAAHRGDAVAAAQLLQAAVAGGLPPDYEVEADVVLARLHRRAHRDAEAERLLRAAIALVEDQRAGGGRELRPWILSHRATPYHELLVLLVDAGRGAEALAVMEALHARAWLDRAAGPPALPPSPTALLALAGDREVLVFVEVAPVLWRAHLIDGEVRVDAIADGTALLADLERGPDDRAAAARAGGALIPDRVLASDRPLYVVASGRLAAVGFAALRRGDRSLVDDRPIAFLPGLVAMRCPRHASVGPPVVIGDSHGDLAAAAVEARAIASGLGVEPHLGASATTAAVIAARDASLLHLAVHGTVSRAGGAIELADGALDAAAIRAHGIAPRLVVLAGCQTGTSQDAETWSALPSAFLTAGSEIVVATTRSVDDRAAAAMMHAFYAASAARLDPIRQLAAAQRAIAHALPASVWASFAAWGVADCE